MNFGSLSLRWKRGWIWTIYEFFSACTLARFDWQLSWWLWIIANRTRINQPWVSNGLKFYLFLLFSEKAKDVGVHDKNFKASSFFIHQPNVLSFAHSLLTFMSPSSSNTSHKTDDADVDHEDFIDILDRLNACSAVMPVRHPLSILAGCVCKASDVFVRKGTIKAKKSSSSQSDDTEDEEESKF